MTKENRINFYKIKEYRRTKSLGERLGMTIGDFMEIRTLKDRVYESKFEFWDERRKDVYDSITVATELCLPPLVKDITNYGAKIVLSPFMLLQLPILYAHPPFSKELKGEKIK